MSQSNRIQEIFLTLLNLGLPLMLFVQVIWVLVATSTLSRVLTSYADDQQRMVNFVIVGISVACWAMCFQMVYEVYQSEMMTVSLSAFCSVLLTMLVVATILAGLIPHEIISSTTIISFFSIFFMRQAIIPTFSPTTLLDWKVELSHFYDLLDFYFLVSTLLPLISVTTLPILLRFKEDDIFYRRISTAV
eukprot:TRINITY_DN30733_c0_g1_i1.p1 TRINITY_DN30733_c0_g1~~TRINITY_DN30733_c0_g1_i1.p1  ORF type:complete len:190 (-),score=31.16 TRINITY_DN30733_c0_g1_i1:251-820(-)